MKKNIGIMLCFLVGHIVSASVTTDTLLFVKQYEGFLSTPKHDVSAKGEIVIGYSVPVQYARQKGWSGYTIDEQTASRILYRRLCENHVELKKVLPNVDTLDRSIVVAISSAYYNNPKFVGKNMQRFLKTQQLEKASRELAWGHAPTKHYGLVVRRFAEANLIRVAIGEEPLRVPASVSDFYKRKKSNYPVS